MKNLYKSTATLDKRLITKYLLSEEILMENAANAMLACIQKIAHKQSVITIVCGSGDNGADGYTLARKLCGDYKVRIYEAKEPKSNLCQIQSERATLCEIERVKKILPCDILIDCLFGSGFSGEMTQDFEKLIESMNANGRYKIACDIPSGLDADGCIHQIAFKADFTICMGALKTSLYSDSAKDVVGEIIVGDLGVGRDIYEITTSFFVLEKSDLKLPLRESKNCHKGNFGHLAVIVGEKKGAATLSALAGFRIGSGLVSVIGEIDGYPEIMRSYSIPNNANVIIAGMGLGNVEIDFCLFKNRLGVIDADLFYKPQLKNILQDEQIAKNLVITPHPKEFVSLLKICDLGEHSLQEIAHNRLAFALEFSGVYPQVVLVLKGANPIIAHKGRIYINPLGSSALAKGGSGDVLSGIIGGYLAQGFSTLDSAIYGSLVHALAAQKEKNSYALTPLRLIEYLGEL